MTEMVERCVRDRRIQAVIATMGPSGSNSRRCMAFAGVIPPSVLRGHFFGQHPFLDRLPLKPLWSPSDNSGPRPPDESPQLNDRAPRGPPVRARSPPPPAGRTPTRPQRVGDVETVTRRLQQRSPHEERPTVMPQASGGAAGGGCPYRPSGGASGDGASNGDAICLTSFVVRHPRLRQRVSMFEPRLRGHHRSHGTAPVSHKTVRNRGLVTVSAPISGVLSPALAAAERSRP